MKAVYSVDSIELNLNEDLASVSEWLTANKLTLNKSKTEFMITGSRQSTKSLDVYIDKT